MADIVHPSNPGVELFEAAHGLVLAAIELRLACGFRARGSERDGGGLVALPRFVPIPSPLEGGGRARGASFLGPPTPTLPRGGGGSKKVPAAVQARFGGTGARTTALRSGIRLDIRRIDLRILGDAAGEGGKFHRLQKRDQLARIGLVHREFVERHV